ncbi:MAG: hypothetical protein INR63_13625 [Actinomycetospora chiangmaiensis]|nr:hypothetical protein [Actinomycetospora chiangmaiensis]
MTADADAPEERIAAVIGALTRALERLAEGDFEARPGPEVGPEHDPLRRAFEAVSRKLKGAAVREVTPVARDRGERSPGEVGGVLRDTIMEAIDRLGTRDGVGDDPAHLGALLRRTAQAMRAIEGAAGDPTSADLAAAYLSRPAAAPKPVPSRLVTRSKPLTALKTVGRGGAARAVVTTSPLPPRE